MQSSYTINQRPIFFLVVLMVCGCTGQKTPAKSAADPSESAVSSKSTSPDDKTPIRPDEVDPRAKAQQRTDDHRTWFRTVLSGG